MGSNLNKLLLRQIKKHFGSLENLPDVVTGIFQDINSTYENFEDDAQLLQNSIEISSQELRDAYQKHKHDAEAQKETINKIKEAIRALNPSNGNGIQNNVTDLSDSSYLSDSLITLIEERKQTEEALRQSEFLMKSLTSTAQDAILMMDPEGRVSYWNTAAERIFGYTSHEAIGRILHDFIVPNRFLEAHHRAFPGFLLTGQGAAIGQTLDLMALRKDGKEISVQLSLSSFQIKDRWHAVGIIRDITQRKQMEDQLKESENLQRSLLENVAVGIVIIDQETRIIERVNTFASLLMCESKEKIIGNKCHLYMCPAQEQCCPVCDKGQDIDNSERILLRGDKSAITVLKTVKRIRLGGKPKLMESFVDITVQKEAEEALHHSSKKWEAIISASPDGIGMASLDGKLQLMSDKLAAMYGYSLEQKDEYIGKAIFDFIDPSNHKMLIENIQKLLLGEHDHTITEYLALKRDNSKFYVDVNSTLLFDSKGNPESILFVERDITSRKQAEEALRQAADRLAIATKAGGVGVWDYDIGPNKLFWDNQMYRLYGIEPDLFSGAYESWQAGVHPDDMVQGDKEIKMAISGEKEFDTEFRVVWSDGSVHNVRALAFVVRDDLGNAIRMIGTNWDITEQKKTEAVLLKARQEADMANKAKSEFLANMSHEIRTPLNGVIGFTDLLQKTPLNKIQRQYADNVNASGHTLLGIINDILDFSKIEAGKMELDHIKTDIIELVEQTSDIIKYHASQKGIELLLNIQYDIPRFVVVDPIRLKQILVNLLGNAVKFTESGEIELKATFAKNDDILGKFTFSVRDTGIGINAEQQKNLFKAFTQADSSTTRKFGGTGLGLTISNMLAGKMGSKIEIVSDTGMGANFFFTLEAEYEVGEKLDPGSLTDINRVLVIDDNYNNRMILDHTFKNWGIEFTGTDNGHDAINIIENSKPFDVIIVDYHMPQINGIDTIKIIRDNLHLSPEIQPIILLHSSSDDLEIYTECKKLGVRFNLTKPVKSQELLHYLKNLHSQTVAPVKENKNELHGATDGMANYFAPVILVGEDVALNMLLVTTIIKQLIPNVTLLKAKNGKETVETAISKNPDLILMDIQMPEMSGIEAAVEIRNYEKNRGRRVPIIALTAGAIKGEKEKCFEAGMDDFLTKPIDREALRKILEIHLTSFKENEDKKAAT